MTTVKEGASGLVLSTSCRPEINGLVNVDWYWEAEDELPPKLVGIYGKEEEAVGEGLT